jgi:hypothetical protein
MVFAVMDLALLQHIVYRIRGRQSNPQSVPLPQQIVVAGDEQGRLGMARRRYMLMWPGTLCCEMVLRVVIDDGFPHNSRR